MTRTGDEIVVTSVVIVGPTGARATVERLWNDGTSGKDFADVRLADSGELVTEVPLRDLSFAPDDVPVVPEGEPTVGEIEAQIVAAREAIARATDPIARARDEGWLAALVWVRGRGPTQTLSEAQDAAAYGAVRAALAVCSGNVTAAAGKLRVSPATLHRQIDRLGLRQWLTDEYERGARQPPR